MTRQIVLICAVCVYTMSSLLHAHESERPSRPAPPSCQDELISPSSREGYNSPANQRLHVLLKEAFFPMVEEFRASVLATDERSLKKLLRLKERQFSIGVSDYAYHTAFLDSSRNPDKRGFFSRFFDPKSTSLGQRQLAIDAWNGREFYGMVERPEFGSSSSHLWTYPDRRWVKRYGSAFNHLGALVTPIGKYGERVARVQLKTTLLLMEMAERTLTKSSSRLFHNEPQIHAHVGRIRQGAKEKATAELTPLGNFLEGLISFNQFVSLALAEGIPGQEDPLVAVQELIENQSSRIGLVSEFTARLPVTALGPMTLSGFYFKDMWERDANNRLHLSSGVQTLLQNMREVRVQEQTQRLPPVGCPMASLRRGQSEGACAVTGLQLISQAYWRVFSYVWRNEGLPSSGF